MVKGSYLGTTHIVFAFLRLFSVSCGLVKASVAYRGSHSTIQNDMHFIKLVFHISKLSPVKSQ
jgi:hypothetical protein